jgi:hypothetical protein
MKNIKNLIMILCLSSFGLFMSCEKAEIHKTSTISDGQSQIEPRSDCEECPGMDECCCAIWLDEDQENADIYLCGTSDVSESCSLTPTCLSTTFSGVGDEFNLDEVGNPRQVFCMYEIGGFVIHNLSPTETVDIVITCQNGLRGPQEVHLTLDPLERFHYKTNGSCELVPCP